MVSPHTFFELGGILSDRSINSVLGALQLFLCYVFSVAALTSRMCRMNMVLPAADLIVLVRLAFHICLKGLKRPEDLKQLIFVLTLLCLHLFKFNIEKSSLFDRTLSIFSLPQHIFDQCLIEFAFSLRISK